MTTTTYLRNNIQFRRLTAGQFAAFFKTKEFLLGEIIDCNKHKFTPSARELLLQYFASLTYWLEETERLFIKRHEVTDDVKSEVVKSFNSALNVIQEILYENPRDFDPAFSSLWSGLQDRTTTTLCEILSSYLVADIGLCFVNIMDFVTGLLNHILFNLHEVDSLVKAESQPFINVDRVDVLVLVQCATSLPNTRVALYKERGLISSNSNIVVKRYVDDRFLGQDVKRELSYQHILDVLRADMCISAIV